MRIHFLFIYSPLPLSYLSFQPSLNVLLEQLSLLRLCRPFIFLELLNMKLFKRKSRNGEGLKILQAKNHSCLNIDLVGMDFMLMYGLHNPVYVLR